MNTWYNDAPSLDWGDQEPPTYYVEETTEADMFPAETIQEATP